MKTQDGATKWNVMLVRKGNNLHIVMPDMYGNMPQADYPANATTVISWPLNPHFI